MSRSGYTDDYDGNWDLIRWRGAVRSAIRGKRGQAFLRDLLAALDALPAPRLVYGEFVTASGDVCALGTVAKARSIRMDDIDPEEPNLLLVGERLGIAPAMAAEIMYENDDRLYYASARGCTPERRFQHVRDWVIKQLAGSASTTASGGNLHDVQVEPAGHELER